MARGTLWVSNAQAEQDLMICRAVIALFSRRGRGSVGVHAGLWFQSGLPEAIEEG